MERIFAPRRQAGRLALAIGLGALLASSATGWAAPPAADEAFGIQAPQSLPKTVKAVRPTPSGKMGIALAPLPEARVGRLDKNVRLKEDAITQQRLRVKTRRVSVGLTLRLSAADG